MDFRGIVDSAQRQASNSYDSGVDALLERFGFEQKRSSMEVILPALGIFGAGIAVGAMLGLMFAPKRGEDLRSDIRHRIGDIREKTNEQYEEIREKSQTLLDSARAES